MAARKKAKTKTVTRKKTAKKIAKKSPVKKTTARKKSAKKKTAARKVAKKTVARKKSAKKKTAAKKKTTTKKTTKKKPIARKKPAKKKTAAKKKTTTKKTAKKKPIARKKSAKKKTAAKKKVAKKASTASKTAKKKPAVTKPAKKAVLPNAGKNRLSELKSKVFRRDPTDIQNFKPYRAERGEEYMNTDQVAHFRKILLDWKKLLMEEVDRTVHHMQDEAANFPDPNDRATQEEEFALELRTRDRERKLIRKIDEAIIDLETGDYGYCEVCGVEIGVKRLEARPTATLCIDCKTLDEIKEKQLG